MTGAFIHFHTNDTPVHTHGSHVTECKLPWVDFVENSNSNVGNVVLICLLLTCLFDTFLTAIILLHDDLRKKARISEYDLVVIIFLF